MSKSEHSTSLNETEESKDITEKLRSHNIKRISPGLYGLKHDIHDVTKHMDEPPLDELLRGTFDSLSLSKDKGKKTSNANESFLNSVRKGCSIPQFVKSIQSQNITDMDSSFNKKMSTCQMSSDCAGEDPCSKNESSPSPLDFPLCQPEDVLERIALPPSQDLESLILDASKLVATTKCSNNLRSGKQVSHQPSLPAFLWSVVTCFWWTF